MRLLPARGSENASHPQDMRRDADGGLNVNGQPSASYLAPDYQRDIVA
jgi:hypothetical protein